MKKARLMMECQGSSKAARLAYETPVVVTASPIKLSGIKSHYSEVHAAAWGDRMRHSCISRDMACLSKLI